jgi:hypothetical protein
MIATMLATMTWWKWVLVVLVSYVGTFILGFVLVIGLIYLIYRLLLHYD